MPADVSTEIGPVAAPLGTVAVICDLVSTTNVAGTPPNFTSTTSTKFNPVMTTDASSRPLVGAKWEMIGPIR